MERKFLRNLSVSPNDNKELFTVINYLYDYIDNKFKEAEGTTQKQDVRLSEFGTLLNTFATKLIGEEGTANPLEELSTSTGTVTSVGAAVAAPLDSVIAISNTPITSTGNLLFSLVNQIKNTFFAGPITGANDKPAFRLIVSNDMPRTSSAADPTTTELPNSGDWCVHKNTSSGFIYLAYNNAGAIVKVQLT